MGLMLKILSRQSFSYIQNAEILTIMQNTLTFRNIWVKNQKHPTVYNVYYTV